MPSPTTTFDVKRVVVLAEAEALFLPDCLARLATLHPLAAIIEVPSPSIRLNLKRGWAAFGPTVMVGILASDVLATIVDRLSRDRFYSLRKLAQRLEIPYEKVSGLHAADCFTAIDRHQPDVIFAQVSSRIRPELLAKGVFWNKHCALLPAYAGVFPVFWALLKGEEDLGVTIHQMDEEFDRGPILAQATISSNGHTFFSAYHELYDLVVPLLDGALRGHRGSLLHSLQQASYYSFPKASDRAAFRSAGLRYGVPFRLQKPVVLEPRVSRP